MTGPGHIVVVEEGGGDEQGSGGADEGIGSEQGTTSGNSDSDSGSEEPGSEEMVVMGPGGEQRAVVKPVHIKGKQSTANGGGGSSEQEEESGSGSGSEEEEEGVAAGEGGDAEGLQQFESVLPGPVAPSELSAALEAILSCHQPPGIRVKDLAKMPNVQ